MQNNTIKICYLVSVDMTLKFILFSHLKFLKSCGYEVHAVSAPGKWIKDIESEGIKVKTIGFKRKIAPISDLISFFRLYFYFRKEKFHIVHTHTLKPEFFGQIAAKLADVPIVVNTLHGLDFQESAPAWKKRLILAIERVSAKFSDLIFSVNKKNIGIFLNEKICTPEKIMYLGNGISVQKFNPAKFSPEFISGKKRQLGIAPGAKVIGIVARMVAEKGYLDLFEAFRKVVVKFPDAVILAIGQEEPDKRDAVDRGTAKEYGIEDSVIFLGERSDLDELYPLMDVFVLPSHREGLPYALLEASAMERPVIAASVGGCPEAIEDGKTGILVPAKNPDKLAWAITLLLSGHQGALAMGKSARKKVIEEFDEQILCKKLDSAYRKLIESNLPPAIKTIKVCCVSSVDMTLKFMLFNQLKYLQSLGYEVHAVSAPGKWIKDIESEGIKVKTIGFKRKIAPISDLISFFRLYFYFRKEKFHIVHTHTLKPEFFGQIAAKLADVPIVVNTLHGFFYSENSSFSKKMIFMLWDKASAKFSDLVLSISRAIIDFAIKEKLCAPGLIQYLGRDVDTERFNPAKFSPEFISGKKRQLGIAPGAKVIGIVARMVAEKGYLDLFEAFRMVIAVFPDALLMVAGQEEPTKKDGVRKDSVKRYGIESNTIFLGERTDTEELYPLMDIFVLPTHREGLGAVILEASAMERPVIAANVGGCPEAIEDGRTGILVPAKDSNRLSEAIIDLLSHPSKAQGMGKAGREKILKEFSKEIVLERLGSYYNSLVRRKLYEYGGRTAVGE